MQVFFYFGAKRRCRVLDYKTVLCVKAEKKSPGVLSCTCTSTCWNGQQMACDAQYLCVTVIVNRRSQLYDLYNPRLRKPSFSLSLNSKSPSFQAEYTLSTYNIVYLELVQSHQSTWPRNKLDFLRKDYWNMLQRQSTSMVSWALTFSSPQIHFFKEMKCQEQGVTHSKKDNKRRSPNSCYHTGNPQRFRWLQEVKSLLDLAQLIKCHCKTLIPASRCVGHLKRVYESQ